MTYNPEQAALTKAHFAKQESRLKGHLWDAKRVSREFRINPDRIAVKIIESEAKGRRDGK